MTEREIRVSDMHDKTKVSRLPAFWLDGQPETLVVDARFLRSGLLKARILHKGLWSESVDSGSEKHIDDRLSKGRIAVTVLIVAEPTNTPARCQLFPPIDNSSETEHLSIIAYRHVDNVKNVTTGLVLSQSSDISRPELDKRKQVTERLDKFSPTSSQEIAGCVLFELDGRHDKEVDKLNQVTESLEKFSLAFAFHTATFREKSASRSGTAPKKSS